MADAMGNRYRWVKRLTETAGLEKVAQRLAFRIRRTEQRRRFPIEAHDLAEQGQVRRSRSGSAAARRTRWRRDCCTRARSAGTTRRTTCPSRGWPRRVPRTAAPGSDRCGRCAPGSRCRAARAPFGPSITTVLVWPPRRSLLFEELHPVPPAQEIGSGQAGDARADDRDVLHAPLEIPVRPARCQVFVHDNILTTWQRSRYAGTSLGRSTDRMEMVMG